MIQQATLQFLKKLSKNNNKPWFDTHRKEYEAAKMNMEQFINQLIHELAAKDASIAQLTAKQCLFRINRDVRFSKNKAPYKTNFGASINKGGKKSGLAGYYFHLEPGQSFLGGGIWMPEADRLKKVRQEVDYCFDEFQKIIGSKKFKTTYGDLYKGEDSVLVRIPKGYEESSPAAAYLKFKSYIAVQDISDEELTSAQLIKKTIKSFETLQPLIQFINRSLE